MTVRNILLLFLYFHSSLGDLASVVWNGANKTYDVKDSIVPDAIAWANFTDQIHKIGWSYLEVSTNGSYPDKMQAYAAGIVEGYLTYQLIYKHWINTVEGYCNDEAEYCAKLKNYLAINSDWMKKQIALSHGNDPYWHQVNLILAQLNGLEEGYRKHTAEVRARRDTSFWSNEDVLGFIMVQISGDLEDLEVVLKKTVSHRRRVFGGGSCSALVKVLPNGEEIFVSQDSWSTYQSMLRILKKYNFQYHVTAAKDSALIPAQTMTFSSYPASLTSGDDFYCTSSGLVTMETTIGNSNPDLWKYVTPEGGVLEWIRSMVANRLSADGETWTKFLSQYNSGTYNNQWMVVDMKLFKPGKPLKADLLWVLEQLPKYVMRADKTDLLRDQLYWPSYNVPYFPFIYNMSGSAAAAAKHGDWFSYDKTPRALIFKRDQPNVSSLETMMKLMRYNDYTHDPLSRCNCTPPYSAENAISARCDLNPKNGTYPIAALGHRSHGGIDMKLTSSKLFSSGLSFVAIGGPSYDSLPPFQWSRSDFETDTPHMGQPDLWKFDPIIFDGEAEL
uniref:Phospholipase B-like n=1 Tax=Strigamia maritima TaxID=126957 RepID=T1IJU9_STRMM